MPRSRRRKPRFLHINPESRHPVFWSHSAPTAEDRAFARVSLRLIVRLSDFRYLGPSGRWLPIGEATLTQRLLDHGTVIPPAHCHPADAG